MPMMMKVKGGTDCPVLLCDHCGDEIEDGDRGRGHYLWRRSVADECEEGDTVEVFFVHRQCHLPWEAEHPKSEGVVHLWMPLKLFPVYLAANIGIDISDAEQDAHFWANLG